jgi:hypothetical protein
MLWWCLAGRNCDRSLTQSLVFEPWPSIFPPCVPKCATTKSTGARMVNLDLHYWRLSHCQAEIKWQLYYLHTSRSTESAQNPVYCPRPIDTLSGAFARDHQLRSCCPDVGRFSATARLYTHSLQQF